MGHTTTTLLCRSRSPAEHKSQRCCEGDGRREQETLQHLLSKARYIYISFHCVDIDVYGSLE